VIDVDRLIPVELKISADLGRAVRLRLFLCHAYEHDAVPDSKLAAELIGDIVFPFFVQLVRSLR